MSAADALRDRLRGLESSRPPTTLLPRSGLPEPWGEYRVEEGDGVDLSVGPLRMRVEKRAGEVRATWSRDGARPSTTDASAAAPKWTRWAASRWDGRILLTPSFPDRPVVVELESAFRLLREAEARIYVRVPLWAHLHIAGDEPTSLIRIPTLDTSDTWWGSLDEGELCYWIPTSARRSYEAGLFQPHLAMCPVQLQNHSDDSLPVERIALRVAYLSLFAEGAKLWADETRVAYSGEPEGSRLDIGGEAPPEAKDAKLLELPRMRMARGFRALTFAGLRALPEWL
jgi:hypothetical protein